MNKDIYIQLTSVIKEENVKIDEPLSDHTTFRIGGAADFFVTPSTIEELTEIVALCKKEVIPYYILGNGSNLLVGDQGYRGVIIHISSKLSEFHVDNHGILRNDSDKEYFKVTAQAGILLSKLACEIANSELTGFEFAAGIPGSLGGAVTMNAGAYNGEMKDHVTFVTVIDELGNISKLDKSELDFNYRMSAIQRRGLIALEVEFEFTKGEKKAIFDTMKELNSRRSEKQPLEYPSAGSTFKRPKGYYAGKLIMDSGLRGYRVGDIMISTKHCGFVINVGKGTAKDVRKLISDVDNTVFNKFGVHLEPEIRFLGEF